MQRAIVFSTNLFLQFSFSFSNFHVYSFHFCKLKIMRKAGKRKTFFFATLAFIAFTFGTPRQAYKEQKGHFNKDYCQNSLLYSLKIHKKAIMAEQTDSTGTTIFVYCPLSSHFHFPDFLRLKFHEEVLTGKQTASTIVLSLKTLCLHSMNSDFQSLNALSLKKKKINGNIVLRCQ